MSNQIFTLLDKSLISIHNQKPCSFCSRALLCSIAELFAPLCSQWP